VRDINDLPSDDVTAALQATPECLDLRNELIRVLNRHEAMSQGVSMGIYDEEYAKKARYSAVVNTYRRLKEYVEYHRRSRNRPDAWADFEALVVRWGYDPSVVPQVESAAW
jgi:hypothetical protein